MQVHGVADASFSHSVPAEAASCRPLSPGAQRAVRGGAGGSYPKKNQLMAVRDDHLPLRRTLPGQSASGSKENEMKTKIRDTH
jgi:hypothetical protein